MSEQPNAATARFDLRGRLKRLGLTQVGFASLVGVDPTTVRAWVRTDPPGPTRRLVEVLEYQLGLSDMPDWIVPLVAEAA